MKPNRQLEWEEEFEYEYVSATNPFLLENYIETEEMRSFIRKKITKARKEAVEEVLERIEAKMVYGEGGYFRLGAYYIKKGVWEKLIAKIREEVK